MKIAIIQQHASTDNQDNLTRGLNATVKAAEMGAKLAVFAELAFTRFFPQNRTNEPVTHLSEKIPGPTTEAFMEKAKEHGMVIVINLFEEADHKTYDSSPVIDADGALLGVTRMVHIADYDCFFEKDYYAPGDRGAPVYNTAIGKVGVAICYDRHYPEFMRSLAVDGADLVVIPQAGTAGEWPNGLFEAELRVASFQNGYYCALANRVGVEDKLEFSGESFVTNPAGEVIAQSPAGVDHILMVDIDLDQVASSHARKLFFRDRRPEVYPLHLKKYETD